MKKIALILIYFVLVVSCSVSKKAQTRDYGRINTGTTANDHIGAMSEVVFGPPIPSAGYIVRLEFNESA